MKNIPKLHKSFSTCMCFFLYVCHFAGRAELFLALPGEQGAATQPCQSLQEQQHLPEGVQDTHTLDISIQWY